MGKIRVRVGHLILTDKACFFVTMYYFHPWRLAKSSIAKQNSSHRVNVINEGSPSRIRRVRRISFGITIRPSSSTFRTIPVAFIVHFLLLSIHTAILCKRWGIMQNRVRGKFLHFLRRFIVARLSRVRRSPPLLQEERQSHKAVLRRNAKYAAFVRFCAFPDAIFK